MSRPRFSPRLSSRSDPFREASLLRSLTAKVQAFPDGINLGQGICELPMPEVLREAALEAVSRGPQTYTPHGGLPELRSAVAARMARRHGLVYDPGEVVITVGASTAYAATIMTLFDPGDELILFEPFYPYHRSAAELSLATIKTVPLRPGEDGIDWDAFRRALGPRTRAVVVNTPSNPLGKVWTAAEIDRLAELLDGTGVMVVTDEIYEDIVFDGRPHVPPATRPGLFERTVTISGVSKSFAVTGWRIGWLAAPEAVARAIGPVFDVLCCCAPRPLQSAVARALATVPEDAYAAQRDGYARRRTTLLAALRDAGFGVREPEGAYYVLADHRGRFGPIPSRDAAFRLQDEIHVNAIPSDVFFAGEAPPALRFQFAVGDAVVDEVARRLRTGLSAARS